MKILIPILLISGCSWQTPEPTILVNTVLKYPVIAEYTAPESIPVSIPKMDWPRTTKLTVKNSRICVDIPETDYDQNLWDICGEYEIDFDSNLEIGLDAVNLEKLNKALIKARARESQWRALLNRINQQIRVWNEQSTGE